MAKTAMRSRKRANPIDLNKIAASAAGVVQSRKDGVELYAKAIVEFMKDLHGGEWRIQIDHDCGLVVVARRLGKVSQPIDPSSLREAV